jgi:soluble lytic murein transglycosylase-like protein
MRAVLLLSVLTISAPAPAAADIYEKVGPDGTRMFTNMPEGKGWKRLLEEVRIGHDNPRVAQRLARRRSFAGHVTEAAGLYNLPEALIMAVIDIESAWNPLAVSRAGAMGLMQLMPGTARSMRVKDAFDARQNILGGTRYLRVLANRYGGDMVLTLSAYNAGLGNVDKHNGVPYAATAGYVEAVLERFRKYRRAD